MRLLLLLVTLWGLGSTAYAKPSTNRIYLWGVQRGCELSPDLTREVEKRLVSMAYEVIPLSPDKKRLGCQGQACVNQLTRECPAVAAKDGRVIGVVVESSQGLHKLRMWSHDLESATTVYKDNFCQGCTLLSSLPGMVAHFTDRPGGQASVGPVPFYCQQEPEPAPEAPPIVKRIYVVLASDVKHKTSVWAFLRDKLAAMAITAELVKSDVASLRQADLVRITSQESGSQLLALEAREAGKYEMTLFDGPSQRTEAREFDCPHCEKDELQTQIYSSLTKLLSVCFGDWCARRSSASKIPPEACEPFHAIRCGGEDPAMSNVSIERVIPGPGAPLSVDPTTANLSKGIVWGLFAASTATAVGLFTANFTVAGTMTGRAQELQNALVPSALVATGFSVLSLAGAIPLTLHFQRKQPSSRGTSPVVGPRASASSSLALHCPN